MLQTQLLEKGAIALRADLDVQVFSGRMRSVAQWIDIDPDIVQIAAIVLAPCSNRPARLHAELEHSYRSTWRWQMTIIVVGVLVVKEARCSSTRCGLAESLERPCHETRASSRQDPMQDPVTLGPRQLGLLAEA